MSNEPAPHLKFPQLCLGVRRQIGDLLFAVKNLHDLAEAAVHETPIEQLPPPDVAPDLSEMHENIVLAYRHLEDARMRIGKSIQAFDGGVSVYDR